MGVCAYMIVNSNVLWVCVCGFVWLNTVKRRFLRLRPSLAPLDQLMVRQGKRWKKQEGTRGTLQLFLLGGPFAVAFHISTREAREDVCLNVFEGEVFFSLASGAQPEP